ncbi:MAG: helix-turn-helix transcriptional regulator [Gammaproteobacteria bacterium]|nr:helix-turn-helix transcriptional regulator [Gammaproteobacteria bacterium]
MKTPDAFDRILASLHRAALDDAQWPAASALIEEAGGFLTNLLMVGELVGDNVRVDFVRCFRRGEPRQDLGRLYFEDYYPRDELPRRLRAKPADQLNHIPDLYTERERKTSRAYREGMVRTGSQKGLITRLDWQSGLRVVWALGNPRGRGGWQSDRIRLIESLLPHVRQFVRIRQTLVGADALSAGLAGLLENSGIGVLHLDRSGRVLAANGPALDILRRGEGLSDRDGALHASLPADDGRLQRLLKRALPGRGNGPPAGGSIRIQRPRLRSRLELHVHPVEAAPADFGARGVAALVLVVDPEHRAPIDPARVATLLGLTSSEARVAALLAEGRSVREIAAATGLKESYVRWLFKQIYKKLDISGQIALVQRVLAAHGLPRR